MEASPLERMASRLVRAPAESFVGQFESNARTLGPMRLYSWLAPDCSELQTLTYAQMRAHAVALCCALRLNWGAHDGERAMLIFPPGLDLLVAFFGCQYAAVIAVPYYPPVIPTSPMPTIGAKRLLADGLAKVKRIADSCEPFCFLSSRSYIRASWLSSKLIRDADCVWPSEWVWHATDECSPKCATLRTRVSLHARKHTWTAWLKASDELWLEEWLPQRVLPASHSEISFLQYTSGSTGHPKGVAIGTRNLLANVMAMTHSSALTADYPPPGSNIIMVSWLPQYHDFGLIAGSLSTAMQGYRSDLMSPFTFIKHPTAWLQAISRLHETHQVISPSPNFGYALVTRRSKPHHLSSFRLSHWKAAFNGAEPIRPKTLADFDAKFEPCGWTPSSWACLYGLAETCVYGCGVAEPPVVLSVARDKLGPGDAPMLCHESDERADADIVEFPGCFIHPSEMTGQHFAISHPETNELLPDGVVGEVRLSGLSVALGYYKLPELSAETFKRPLGVSKSDAQLLPGTTESGDQPLPASYLCTGDLGFIWERRLYIVGRLKDVLCIRGRTLHAHDVESCAEGAASDLRPGCTAAFPVSPDDGDEALVLIAELKPETATDSETLAHVVDQVVRGVLDGEGIKPHAVVLIKARSILKTTSGKLRRRELRNAYAQIDAMALAGELASGVAPHVHPATAPRSRAFGFLSSRVPEKPKPLIPADSVLFFWKEVGLTSRHAADATLAASGSASERAALSSRSEGALPDMQPSQQTNSDKNGREESPENSPVLDPLDDPKAASDARWAMCTSYAAAWGCALADSNAAAYESSRCFPDNTPASMTSATSLGCSEMPLDISTPASREASPISPLSSLSGACTVSKATAAAENEAYATFGQCRVEGLEVLLAGCNLTRTLDLATAWFDEQGLDSVTEMRKVGMESEFVTALGLKPGKAKSLMIDIAAFH